MLVNQPRGIHQVRHPNSHTPDLVAKGGPDPAASCADGQWTAQFLVQLILETASPEEVFEQATETAEHRSYPSDSSIQLIAELVRYQFRFSTASDGSAQSRAAMNGCDFDRTVKRYTARRCDLSDVYEELADRFREVRLALNRLSDSLLNLDEDSNPSLLL